MVGAIDLVIGESESVSYTGLMHQEVLVVRKKSLNNFAIKAVISRDCK